MLRAGFRDPDEFRRLTYIAALMRCFPGRNAQNTGDLRPPPAGIANCAHWLDAELRLLRPKVLILVGQLAIARFLGRGSLEDAPNGFPESARVRDAVEGLGEIVWAGKWTAEEIAAGHLGEQERRHIYYQALDRREVGTTRRFWRWVKELFER